MNISHADGDSLLDEYAAQKRVELVPAMIYIGVVITAGVIGNAFTIAYYGFKVTRSPSNVFISTLAVIDLITCVVFYNQIIHLYHFFTFKSVVGCKIYYFLIYWFVFCSGFMLVVISIDRYRKLCRPFKSQFNMFSSKVAICLTVVFSLLNAIKGNFIVDVQTVNITNTDNETFNGYHCLHKTEQSMRKIVTAFYLIDLGIPSLMVVYFIIVYGLIIRKMVSLKLQKAGAVSEPNITEKGARSIDTTPKPTEQRGTSSDDTTENVGRRDHSNEDITETETDFSNDISTDVNIKHKSQCRSASKITNRVSYFKKKSDKENNIEVKITVLMIVITVVFMISYTPYFIIVLYLNVIMDKPIYELNVGIQIVFRFFVINNVANPYIFLLFNRSYRRFVRDICKHCICYRK